jgi:NADPH-dependent 2,4-dienoyl-CoA reductase/sulfur reductase-like enzyme/nitrite reductase/ring-hydroxylating ferredoxin subunit
MSLALPGTAAPLEPIFRRMSWVSIRPNPIRKESDMARQTIRADIASLKDGQMRVIGEGDNKALLVRYQGQVNAFAATCPHYGAPLEEGLLCEGRIFCPWHKAAFDATDGHLCEPPALDGLARYPVEIDGDQAIVTLDAMPGTSPPAEADQDEGIFGIVGTGAVGVAAARALREYGYAGRIVMIGHEAGAPYDRPSLSKNIPAGDMKPDETEMASSFYQDNAIDFRRLDVEIVDVPNRRIAFRDGAALHCDVLLVATGSTPLRLDVPGANLGNILTLRSLDDARHLADAAKAGHRVVIVGSSFIGMEVAGGLIERGLAVDIVSPESVPFAKQFGPCIGGALLKRHRDKGVTFHGATKVERFEGDHDLRTVHLSDGTSLKADFALVAIGVEPATDMLRGVRRRDDGSVMVDQYLSLGNDVYAAGDIATFPDPRGGKPARIEHWRLAEQQGRAAAANMLGRKQPFISVPFFWTEQLGQRIDYAGYAPDWDEVVIHGDPETPDFIAYYLSKGRVLAASAANRDRQIIAFMRLLESGKLPSTERLRAEDIDLTALVH